MIVNGIDQARICTKCANYGSADKAYKLKCLKAEANGAHPVAVRNDESKCGRTGVWFVAKQ